MSVYLPIPERIPFLEPEVEEKVAEIVMSKDRSGPFWHDSVAHDIRKFLQTRYQIIAEKRILFGVDEKKNQVFVGTFEHWGNGVVLFVPISGYKDFLSFTSTGRKPGGLKITGYGFTTARNEFDNAFFVLDLQDEIGWRDNTGPFGSLSILDAGGETKFSVPEEQNHELFEWFANIL